MLEVDETRTLLVRVTDRHGSHEIWLRPEHVRGHVLDAEPGDEPADSPAPAKAS